MKYLVLIISAIITLSFSQSHRYELPVGVRDQIYKQVNSETYAKRYKIEGKVHVCLEIDDFHLVHIRDIEGTHAHLVEYVQNKIDHMEVYGRDLKPGTVYELNFQFHALKSIDLYSRGVRHPQGL